MSSKPIKKGRPSKVPQLCGSIAKLLSEPLQVKNVGDGQSSRTSRQTIVNSFTTDKDDLENVSTSALLQVKGQLFSEIEEIQKKVNLSLKNKELEIEKLVKKNSELASNNNDLLEKNKVLENDNKALTRKIQSMATTKEVSELQEEKAKLNLLHQEKEEKLSKLVDLITPLRKKVKEQEALREQLNQASGEIKSFHIVNEEFKKELSGSKKTQEALDKKEKELDILKQSTESFLEKSKKGICEEQSKLQKERQYFKDQKNKLDNEKMKVQEEQIRLSYDSKNLEELKRQLNEEKQLVEEEKKAIEDDKITLDNEWGDIMLKKKDLEEMDNVPNIDGHREVIKENQEQLEKIEKRNRLLHEVIATKESNLKDLALKHNLLKDKLNVMREGFTSEVTDLRTKYMEANISKETLDQELKSKTKTVVSLQEELSSNKQNLEKRIEAYKMNQGKISKMIMKQKEDEIDELKQHICELVSTRKRKQKNENDDEDSIHKKMKTMVRSEPTSVVQQLPNISEENDFEDDNDASAALHNNVDNVTSEGGAEVNASSALKQIDEFESFLKTNRNKTQETVKQLINNGELVDAPGSLLDQSEKMDNLIQQTELVSSTKAVPDHVVKSVRDVFDDSDSGREVRKMPVEINGETIWVECVPGGGQGVQGGGENRQQQVQQDQEGGIMMEIGDSDGLEIPGQGGAKTAAKPSTVTNTKNLTAEQRNQIVHECVEDQVSPTDLAKKWQCNADTIRTWVRKAGKQLPKQYKKSTYPPDPQIRERIPTPGTSKQPPGPGGFSRMPELPTAPLPPGQVGVAVGDPPTIDSPPSSQEGGSGSTSISSPSPQYPAGPHPPGSAPKRVLGKLAMCKSCGHLSEDLSTCIRCRRKLPDDVKLLDDPAFKPKPDSTDHVAKKALRGVRLPTKNRRKANPDEPVCIALSSDEEGDDDNSRSSLVDNAEIGEEESGEGSVISDANIVDGSHPGQWCSLPCRSIRIGNYKVLPKEKITITDKGVQIKVPAIINTTEVVTINIPMSDVLKVLAHFGKSMPLLFLYISPSACVRARRTLKMTNSQSFFLDVQSNDETQKRITILPERLTEDNKAILKQHFGSNVQELESKDANEILVRSSPKDLPMLKSKMGGVNLGSSGDRRPGEQQVVKYCQYPPDGAGNVSVTNEDYNCLEAEQFLNDVIIDFYLKFLQHGKFTNIKEVMDRTHIFTTYFYKRLTTRPSNNSKVKAHPIEDNPNLSAAEKRYERVKKWTKKVNLFEKDFIVVPINEHAHWFVCVICFPGQSGCVRADDLTPCETPPGQARNRNRMKKKNSNSKKPLTIGSTTIIPLKGRGQGEDNIRYTLEEEMSDRDEAEASDEDLDDEAEDENGSRKLEEGAVAKTAVRQPCILTFDSLTGGSKARTHQTLREYLSCEWKNKMVPSGAEEKVFTKDNMVGGCPKVQQQPNFSDCGIYLLQYVESFFRDPIGDYSLPISSIKDWFEKDEVEKKRDNIANLIRDLATKQNPGKEFNYPELNFFNEENGEDSDDEDDEDYEGDQRQQHQNLQIVGANSSLMRISAGTSTSRLMVTPAKQGQGKVLIQRTGNQLKMSPYTSSGIPGVPAGVTVTPAPARLLASNNISIRKMSVVSSSNHPSQHSVSVGPSSSIGEAVQTSPDSTSHEDIMGDHMVDRDRRDDSQDQEQDRSSNVPDSQGFESAASKRSAEMGGFDGGNKRVKSDSDT